MRRSGFFVAAWPDRVSGSHGAANCAGGWGLTDLLRWGSVFLPEKSWLNRRVDGLAVVLRDRRAALLGTAAAVGVAASLGFGVVYIVHAGSAARQAAAVAREERANAALQNALAQLRDEVGATSQALRQAEGQIGQLSSQVKQQAAATQQATSSQTGQVAQLAQALDQAERELHLTEGQRATLMARLSMAETKQARQERAAATEWQQKMQALTADRDQAARERDELRARLNQLRQKLSLSRSAPAAGRAERRVAAARPAPTAASGAAAAAERAPRREIAVIVPGRAPIIAREQTAPASERSSPAAAPATVAATGRLAEVERVLASTGVDVKRMFGDFGNRSGLGGPFVAMSRGALAANRVSAIKLAALPGLVSALPTAAPMRDYRETSPFGERVDPFNGRSAFHPGIDLAAPYGTPVFATAAGVVTFAGWSGGYGKIVEITHGHGIVTRYGHLARYVVLTGESVRKGAEIGYEGSTGRSTGPHVIYEIDVNGEPQDPAKFMGLARLLPVAER
jgi:murein DD-endopeptidase MepM/ murein hydrolase activator NlpD